MSSIDQQDLQLDDRPQHRYDVASYLSMRERQVVMLISRGFSNQEIAESLHVSINSVKTYIRTAYRRLDVTRRPQAVIWGIRNEQRLVELEELDARAARAGLGPDPTTKRALWMVRPDQP